MVEKVRERKVAIRFLSTFERLQRTRLGKICSMHHLKYAAPYKNGISHSISSKALPAIARIIFNYKKMDSNKWPRNVKIF